MEYITARFNGLIGPEFVDESSPLLDLGELPANSFRGVASFFGGMIEAFIPSIIHPGAFAKTLDESQRRDKVKILLQHDIFTPLGLPTRLFEGGEGLVLEAKISRTRDGVDTLILMRDGVLDALSIGFDPVKFDFEELPDGTMIRNIREIRLFEISIVTFGADPNARITEVNQLMDERGEAFKTAMNTAGINYGKLGQSVVNPYRDLRIGECHSWSADKAATRVAAWAGAPDNPKYTHAFALQTADGPKLQIADVVDGRLTVVPEALNAAAMQLVRPSGLNLSKVELDHARYNLEQYFVKLDRPAPWAVEGFDTKTYEGYSQADAAYLIANQLRNAMTSNDPDLGVVKAAKEALTALCDNSAADPATPPVTAGEDGHEHLASTYAAMEMEALAMNME